MNKLKVLNLYAGIGGNRKLWQDVEVTAVEYDPKIAAIYQDFFPNDTVIVGDAHQYLLDHYKEYNDGFIWGSPPCPTHSRVNYFLKGRGVIRYPDMKLYEEVIFLQHIFEGKYCIENVISYYEPLIKPQQSGRHFFWSNFKIPFIKSEISVGRMCGKKDEMGGETQADIRRRRHLNSGFDLSKYNFNTEQLINNCVDPEIGLSILNAARGIIAENKVEAGKLF